MRIGNVLGNQDILLVLDSTVFLDHFDATPARRVGRLHDPQRVLVGILAYHLESFEVEGEDIGGRHKVIGFRVGPTLLVQVLPHVVFTTQLPAPREMVHLLVPVHSLQSLLTGAGDIEEDVPIVGAVGLTEAVELQGVYYAFVLGTGYPVLEIGLL